MPERERLYAVVREWVFKAENDLANAVHTLKPGAFMNVEIFEALHRAGLVIVDLTGVRPNCMMELGYALARRGRIVISAKQVTTGSTATASSRRWSNSDSSAWPARSGRPTRSQRGG